VGLGVVAGLAVASAVVSASAREFVDSAGRRVEIPDGITRVYQAGGPASVILYVLAPDRLLGWNRPLTPSERIWVPAAYANLPTLGRLTGRGNTANVEVVVRTRPDVIVDHGSVRGTYVSLADRADRHSVRADRWRTVRIAAGVSHARTPRRRCRAR
jgi:iron complex transport system substrate-binding protein